MKRGESGLCLLVAVDKPSGMSSHDVVNVCRRVFKERRVGHTGTLDPLATGVLPLCVGPATRLDQYMTAHDKRYCVDIAFGFETDTDDSQGQPTVQGSAPSSLLDEEFVQDFLSKLVGTHMQVPPQYSAIKVNGKKAYELARGGNVAQLDPRPIEVYAADFVACGYDEASGLPYWSVDFSVSKGTYIRALARDIGRAVGCPAHVSALRRLVAGTITIDDCVSLEGLEARGIDAALDPVAVLGMRYAFGDDVAKLVNAGNALAENALSLCEPISTAGSLGICACMGKVVRSAEPPKPGELVCVVLENRLKAIYCFDDARGRWTPSCVFSTPILRN